MTDPRPVVYCARCKQDVVALPNGFCPWCEHRIFQPLHQCRCGALAIPKTMRCYPCTQADRAEGICRPAGRPRRREVVEDTHIPALEAAYGRPVTDWYPPRALLAIEGDA